MPKNINSITPQKLQPVSFKGNPQLVCKEEFQNRHLTQFIVNRNVIDKYFPANKIQEI